MNILSINPADNSVNKKYRSHTAKQVKQKVEQTHLAWQKWRLTTFRERSTLLYKMAGILNERKAGLARLMAVEMGKPLKQGVAEIEKMRSGLQLLCS